MNLKLLRTLTATFFRTSISKLNDYIELLNKVIEERGIEHHQSLSEIITKFVVWPVILFPYICVYSAYKFIQAYNIACQLTQVNGNTITINYTNHDDDGYLNLLNKYDAEILIKVLVNTLKENKNIRNISIIDNNYDSSRAMHHALLTACEKHHFDSINTIDIKGDGEFDKLNKQINAIIFKRKNYSIFETVRKFYDKLPKDLIHNITAYLPGFSKAYCSANNKFNKPLSVVEQDQVTKFEKIYERISTFRAKKKDPTANIETSESQELQIGTKNKTVINIENEKTPLIYKNKPK